MIQYITRRLLLFIPTLVAISLLAFIISVNAPGDPVERMVSSSDDGALTQSYGQEEQKSYWRKKLGLDLPLFYFSLRRMSEPANYPGIWEDKEIESIKRLSEISGNPQSTISFHQSRMKLIHFINEHAGQLSDSLKNSILPDLLTLKYAASFEEINFRLNRVESSLGPAFRTSEETGVLLSAAITAFSELKTNTSRWKNFIPVFEIHPFNQYHRWLFGDGNWITGAGAVHSKGIVRGDFGMSYQTRQPVSEVIGEKIGWSLLFSVLSILLAYAVSIPVGVWSGAHKGSSFDKGSSLVLFVLYSMPTFWIATLLLMTFANPDVFHWLPASGIKPAAGYQDTHGFLSKAGATLPYMILPLICYTYSSFAFISRTTRVAMLETMNRDYIRTARAKGLSDNSVIFKHAFRNSLLPLITIFANVFPMAIGGSVIIETIFSIPGMGYETVQSIYNQNYPMIVAIFTLSGVLTVAGYLVSDILYAFADPRITYTGKR